MEMKEREEDLLDENRKIEKPFFCIFKRIYWRKQSLKIFSRDKSWAFLDAIFHS